MKLEVKRKNAASQTKNLFAPDDSSDEGSDAIAEPVWLVTTTKKHIVDQKRLKPGKIAVPHSLNNFETVTICLITADPQRAFKDAIAQPLFPTSLSSKITRVIDIGHLKAKTKSFEERRQLLNEHDMFLADDRVITLLPRLLGKTFYGGVKRPIPVSLEGYKEKGLDGKRAKIAKDAAKSIGPPAKLAKEIERALGCAQVHLSPSVTTSIRVGLTSFTPNQLAENIEAVVGGMTEKFVPKGWRNIRSLHIKGPTSMALPLWLADELWVDEADVLEAEEAEEAVALASQKGRKRKGREGEADREASKKKTKKIADSDLPKEMAERREKLRAQKKEARERVEGKLVVPMETIQTLEGSEAKVKSKKTKAAVALPVA